MYYIFIEFVQFHTKKPLLIKNVFKIMVSDVFGNLEYNEITCVLNRYLYTRNTSCANS